MSGSASKPSSSIRLQALAQPAQSPPSDTHAHRHPPPRGFLFFGGEERRRPSPVLIWLANFGPHPPFGGAAWFPHFDISASTSPVGGQRLQAKRQTDPRGVEVPAVWHLGVRKAHRRCSESLAW